MRDLSAMVFGALVVGSVWLLAAPSLTAGPYVAAVATGAAAVWWLRSVERFGRAARAEKEAAAAALPAERQAGMEQVRVERESALVAAVAAEKKSAASTKEAERSRWTREIVRDRVQLALHCANVNVDPAAKRWSIDYRVRAVVGLPFSVDLELSQVTFMLQGGRVVGRRTLGRGYSCAPGVGGDFPVSMDIDQADAAEIRDNMQSGSVVIEAYIDGLVKGDGLEWPPAEWCEHLCAVATSR